MARMAPSTPFMPKVARGGPLFGWADAVIRYDYIQVGPARNGANLGN